MRKQFNVTNVYKRRRGSVLRTAITTTSPEDGGYIEIESDGDFDTADHAITVEGSAGTEVMYFRGITVIDDTTSRLTGITRPNTKRNHASGSFVQAGSSPFYEKIAVGYFDDEDDNEVVIHIREDLWPAWKKGQRDAADVDTCEAEDDDDAGEWLIVTPPIGKTFQWDHDLEHLPPVAGGDSSTTTTDPISGKILPPAGQGFEDGSVPSGSLTVEAFGGIGNIIYVRWTTIANSSAVTYDIHCHTTTGFTPADNTKVGTLSLAGTAGFKAAFPIKDFPSGHVLDGGVSDPPQPGTTYYVKIVPRDGSGAGTTSTQVSATPVTTASTLAAGSITETLIATDAVTTPKIAANAVTAAEIAANTITASQIAAGTITTTEIAAATITGGDIAASTITASNLSVSTLSAITADLGTVTAGSITGVTVTGGTIQTATSSTRVVLSTTPALSFYYLTNPAITITPYSADQISVSAGLRLGGNMNVGGTGQVSSTLTIGGPLDHDGTTVGFYGVTPTTRISMTNLSGSDSTTAQLHAKLNNLLDNLRTIGLLS